MYAAGRHLRPYPVADPAVTFDLPVTFTVGPRDDHDNLIRYSRFLLGQDAAALNTLVKGVIEGETRILAGEWWSAAYGRGRPAHQLSCTVVVVLRLAATVGVLMPLRWHDARVVQRRCPSRRSSR